MLIKVKVKVTPEQATKAQRWSWGIALLFNLGARCGWEVNATSRLYPPGKTRYPLHRRLGGPQGRCGRSPPPEFDPRTVKPVASHYTDWATRPTVEMFMRPEILGTCLVYRTLEYTCTQNPSTLLSAPYFHSSESGDDIRMLFHWVFPATASFPGVNTGMRRITTFRSTTDRIYDGGPIIL
jgi:hypothetical protein